MRYIQESGITKKASRETGALTAFYKQLSRRAHLLTTRKANGVLPTADVRSARLRYGCCPVAWEVNAYRHIPS